MRPMHSRELALTAPTIIFQHCVYYPLLPCDSPWPWCRQIQSWNLPCRSNRRNERRQYQDSALKSSRASQRHWVSDYIINDAAIVRFPVLTFTGCMVILALQNPGRDFYLASIQLCSQRQSNTMSQVQHWLQRFLLAAIENSGRKVIINMRFSLASIHKDLGSASYAISNLKVGLNMLVGDLLINCLSLDY